MTNQVKLNPLPLNTINLLNEKREEIEGKPYPDKNDWSWGIVKCNFTGNLKKIIYNSAFRISQIDRNKITKYTDNDWKKLLKMCSVLGVEQHGICSESFAEVVRHDIMVPCGFQELSVAIGKQEYIIAASKGKGRCQNKYKAIEY